MFRQRRNRIIAPKIDKRLKTSWFQPSNDTIKEQEAILASTYFLVRQGNEFGERLRCTRCNLRHDYITLMCVEKPITGLAGGLYAYYRALKDNVPTNELTVEAAHRLQQIEQVLQSMPDVASVHPQFARQMTKDVGPSDLQSGAVSHGILEGISPTDARRLVQRINDRGLRPPYQLVQPSAAEIGRADEYRPRVAQGRW